MKVNFNFNNFSSNQVLEVRRVMLFSTKLLNSNFKSLPILSLWVKMYSWPKLYRIIQCVSKVILIMYSPKLTVPVTIFFHPHSFLHYLTELRCMSQWYIILFLYHMNWNKIPNSKKKYFLKRTANLKMIILQNFYHIIELL